MAAAKDWIEAFRLRTLPLAFSCILMGAFLAASSEAFDLSILGLSLLTTLFLQILSNLANDYGDSISGVDSADRQGPSRTVQSGKISKEQMRVALIIFSLLAFATGLTLIFVAFNGNWKLILAFLLLGIASIIAAIRYTVGSNPYGYAGFGDLFVFIFFGLTGVCGSYFLHTQDLPVEIILPAVTCGLFSVGVLNINNTRDIDSDKAAGKRSIPVRIGHKNALRYQVALISLGWFSMLVFSLATSDHFLDFVYLLALPLFVLHLSRVFKAKEPSQLDPLLKQLAILTMLFVLLFGVGFIF